MRTRQLILAVAVLASLIAMPGAARAAPVVELRQAGVGAELVVRSVPSGGAAVLVDGQEVGRLARPGVVRLPLARLRSTTSVVAVVGGESGSESRVELVVARARLVGPSRRGLRLTEGVPGSTTASTARVAFTLPRGLRASCRVDRRRSRSCNRGLFAVANLAPGPHAIRIRLLGRRRTQLVHRFTVIPSPPAVAILRAPASVVEHMTVRIGWQAVGGAAGRTVCSVDGRRLAECPPELALARLPAGRHVIRISLANAGGRGSAALAVRVTARPPDAPPEPPVVTITRTPPSTRARTATIAWSTSGLVDEVRCSLDGAVPVPCSSPVVRTGLGPGDHAFVVTATGPDGIESATATWRVLRRRLLWGAWVYGAAYGFDSVPWDMRGLQAFEANAGATPAIVHFGQPWRSSAGFGTYHPAPYNAIRGHGSIPMVDWSPWDWRTATPWTSRSSRSLASSRATTTPTSAPGPRARRPGASPSSCASRTR